MADRNDWDRERDWDREHGRWPWDRNRETGERGREDWDRERGRESYGRDPRWGSESRYYWPERGDYDTRGDWGRQGSWGAYGNRPDFNRDYEWRRGQQNTGEWERNRPESEYGRSGWSGWGSYSGGMGAYGGGMGSYWERGRFTGRGPKNWQRSDDRIMNDVSERLTDHPDIDATEIEVEVKDGEVTLKGAVDHRGAKRLAEDIAQNVSGVKDVHNHLKVEHKMQEQGVRTGGATGSGEFFRNR